MIALDLSRLLSRAGHATATGIDRVELAYARHLLDREPAACFAATTVAGRLGLLPPEGAARFITELASVWQGAGPTASTEGLARRLRLAALFGGERALRARLDQDAARPVYLHVSHLNLENRCALTRLKARTGARVVCLVHDLIPIELPAYTRPGQTLRHRRRIATVATLADAVIVNSAATRAALLPYLQKHQPPVVVAPPGVDLPAGDEAAAPDPPYFICIGTIEPRKNHRLLFDVWRRLAAKLGDEAPRLLLVGRRGWDGDRIMAGMLRGPVVEHNDVPDVAMARLLRGSRALLMPSLAEGFGLPVAEALACGVPVLCSDLPTLRECGGAVPDYLDPRDPAAWHAAILDYAPAGSPRRAAQLHRLVGWRPPRWSDHFALVDALIRDLA